MPGTVDNPVRLSPARDIREVHWGKTYIAFNVTLTNSGYDDTPNSGGGSCTPFVGLPAAANLMNSVSLGAWGYVISGILSAKRLPPGNNPATQLPWEWQALPLADIGITGLPTFSTYSWAEFVWISAVSAPQPSPLLPANVVSSINAKSTDIKTPDGFSLPDFFDSEISGTINGQADAYDGSGGYCLDAFSGKSSGFTWGIGVPSGATTLFASDAFNFGSILLTHTDPATMIAREYVALATAWNNKPSGVAISASTIGNVWIVCKRKD